MIVVPRSADLKYPPAVRREKILLCLDWLLEFRFSSQAVLAARLGQRTPHISRVIASMLEDGLIKFMKNVHTRHQRFFYLAAGGVSILEGEGRDVSRAVTRADWLGRYSRIMHDLAVQHLLVKRLSGYREVLYERNYSNDASTRPDAIVFPQGKTYGIAVEYERWRKSKSRIYMAFCNHKDALVNGDYNGVYLFFERDVDMHHYKSLFDADAWPVYRRAKGSGSPVSTGEHFLPSSVRNLREVFFFNHDPVLDEDGGRFASAI